MKELLKEKPTSSILPSAFFNVIAEDRRSSRRARLAHLVFLAALAVTAAWSMIALRRISGSSSMAKGPIHWRSCGSNFECGNLTVPLDYTNESDGRTAKLALVRYLATDTDSRLGSLVIEPGGPGGSGTAMAFSAGPNISRAVLGRYDIVGFDPRGINLSEPTVSCFENDDDRAVYARAIQKLASSGPHVLAELDAWHEVLGRGCEALSPDSISYVSTAFVARDLDRIADALGQDKLDYWGFSYGTGIGATFTAMFPDRVGKFVLDACEFPFDGRSALMFAQTSLDDVNKVFDAFFETCASVGPSRCSLMTIPGKTAVDLRAEVESLLLSLQARPLAVARENKPGIVDRGRLLGYIYTSLYRPNLAWPKLADVLHSLIAYRNGSSLLDETAWKTVPRAEQGLSVVCSDASPADDISVQEWAAQLKKNLEISFISGEIRGLHTFPCRQWRGRAKERYLGRFNKTLANPVLLIGGTHDPATPLRNARRLAQDMGPNARLIVHHGFGHSSMRHISACTAQHIQDVFLTGRVPDVAETHCMPTEELFPDRTGSFDPSASLSDEHRTLVETMRHIGENLDM